MASEVIENFDVLTPRDCYDQGYDDGLRRGMEMFEIERMKNAHVQRHLDALQKAIARHNMMADISKPIVILKEDWMLQTNDD